MAARTWAVQAGADTKIGIFAKFVWWAFFFKLSNRVQNTHSRPTLCSEYNDWECGALLVILRLEGLSKLSPPTEG